MPLQSLIEYFNDRFIMEHRSSLKPFIFKNGRVNAVFGTIKIDSSFLPVRTLANPTDIIGHIAKVDVSSYPLQHLQDDEINNLLDCQDHQVTVMESIINFDRLCRTVHMLNYLVFPSSHSNYYLFLDVDPRHVLGIKKDHGVYFEEVIKKCGLETNQVIICLSIHKNYINFYDRIIFGLTNYRQQGYKILVHVDSSLIHRSEIGIIAKIKPDYVALSGRTFFDMEDYIKHTIDLEDWQTTLNAIGVKTILKQVDHKKMDTFARHNHFDFVEGNYYRSIPSDDRKNICISSDLLLLR